MTMHVTRPMSGGTLNGVRPQFFKYWRVGYGSAENFPLKTWIERAGEFHCKPEHRFVIDAYYVASWTRIYYQIAGEAVVQVDRQEFNFEPGDLLIVPSGSPHTYDSIDGSQYHWFGLAGEWLELLGAPPRVRHLTLSPDFDVAAFFVAIREALIMHKPGYPLRALGLVYELCGRLEELQNRTQPHSEYPEAVRNAMVFLQENYARPFRAAELAAEVNLSQSWLRALFEKWVGESPKRFHTRCRIDQAKRLISEQHIGVGEAALQVGFQDTRYFSQVFKQLTGVTPREYTKAR